MYLLGILCLVAATAALPVLPDPPTLTNSVAAAHEGSEMQIYNQHAATDSASLQDIKDNDEVKNGVFQIGSVIFPPPPTLQLFDYSILRKQKVAQKQKYDDTVKQKCEDAKKEIVFVISGKPVKVEVPPNPATLTGFVTPFEDSEDRANIIHDSVPVAVKKDDEEVKHNRTIIATVVMPSLPELSRFDESILRQPKAKYNLKSECFAKQATKQPKEEKQVVILDLEDPVKVEVPANPAALIDSVTAAQDSELCSNIFIVATDSALIANKKDDKEVEPNMVKVASTVIPAPPELSVFDYSILEKQLADQKQKLEEALEQEAEKSKKVKEVVILDQENPDKVSVQPNPGTLTGFVPVLKNSEGPVNIIHVGTDSAPVTDDNDDEKVEHSMAKIATIVIPSPPELPPFDYSILRHQKADYNLKSEYSSMQVAKNSKKEKEALIVDFEEPVKVEMPANPTTLIDSVTAAQDSAVSDLVGDKKDDEEVKPDMVKITSIVIPAPPELSVFDYSILEKQLADQKQKLEEALKQEAEKSKKVKEVVILHQENPVKVSVRPNPTILTGFVPVLKNSEGRVNIIREGTDSAPGTDENDDEKVEHSMTKIATIVIPSPPELPPFDYSILRHQKADYNLKSEYSSTQAAEPFQKEKEALIVDLGEPVKVEVPANPTALIDSVTQDSEVSALVADKKDDEEVKHNMVKIASIVIPAPPELSVFDYSILEKELADQKQKLEEALKQEAEKSIKVKEVVILDQEKSAKVEMPADKATLIDSVTPPRNSQVRANILNIATDSAPVADNKDDEKVKLNMVKIATVVIPPSPPELPPFDYSILKGQKVDYDLRSKQAAEKSKEEKEAVILDLEKPVKINVRPNPETLTDFVTELHDSEVRANILNIATDSAQIAEKKDDEEGKHNIVKIAAVIIPSPPELPPFDYSILKNHKVDQKQKSDRFLKLEAEKSKKENNVLTIEESVKIKEPKLIKQSQFVRDSKPVEESKVIEVLKKEQVKHLEDIPVIIQWTITSAPLLSKLISNYPPLPGVGVNWPLQRSSKSLHSAIIDPKFNLDGYTYTN